MFYLFSLVFGCREKYVPNLNLPATSYLVVEGFINSGTGPTTITLTRTTKLVDTSKIFYERKATVSVEGKINTTAFPLTETGPGVYTISQLTLNVNDQYRVYIKTQAGKEYVSDYSAVRTTPDIDSVSWKSVNTGVQIYANTHDAQGKTKYYQYKYDETWEFHSQYYTSIKVFYNALNRPRLGYRDSSALGNPDRTLFTCWKSTSLTNILVATSEKLTQDVISEQPLVFIEPDSWKLSVLYSINLKQFALSQQRYRFLEQLKKNTEQLGSIFDAQPSDNNGNIHCITNKEEPAIGFVEVSQEKQKRIFISNTQLPDWRYYSGCKPQIEVKNIPDSLNMASGLLATYVAERSPFGEIVSGYFAEPDCVDCTFRGSNKKPPFWP